LLVLERVDIKKGPSLLCDSPFKITTSDGKKRLDNVLDDEGIVELAKQFPSKQENRFLQPEFP
jgi:hypothetical protein